MKCLSVIQPWATLIVLGAKRFETRPWRTSHRGRLAIHACRNFPEESRVKCLWEPFRSVLRQAGFCHPADLPRGAVIGTVDLFGCAKAEDILRDLTESPEADFGDYGSGRWAWRLANPVALATPLRFCGRLGLFDVPELAVLPPVPDMIAGQIGPPSPRSA